MPRRWEREQDAARRYMQNVRASVGTGLAVLAGDILLPNRYSKGIRDIFRVCVVYSEHFLHVRTKYGYDDEAPTFPTIFLMSHHRVWDRRLDGHILSDWSLCLFVPGECDIDFRLLNSMERLLEVTTAFLVLQRRRNSPPSLFGSAGRLMRTGGTSVAALIPR